MLELTAGMRILFLSDNFSPEGNAPAARLHEHALRWVRDGHAVTVITCAPNFPEGKLFPGYRNRWRQVEVIDGIRVVRVKTYITANEGFLK
ncbi:glycosyltransferase, partial [mine drainage metagenome]